MSSMNDDKDLIQQTLQGDKEAFEMLIRKYQNSLLTYIGRMVNTREMALDFTQDVFIKTYTNLHTYRPQYKFSTWLFKIASNTMIDFWRKKKLDTFSIDQRPKDDDRPQFQLPDDEISIEVYYELSQIRNRIEEILAILPYSHRELFVLRHVNEFSYDEIAEIKNIPVGTVKNRVFQIKEMIRKKLEKDT
jgi:RNA polymerase sigma-70 factor (ECF subfamily)